MSSYLFRNATLVNEGRKFTGDLLVKNDRIAAISESPIEADGAEVINAKGKWLMPGVIDDQVHFREPGLTHKEDIASASRAAAAGGTTTYMEMPNTVPNTLTQGLLQDKYDRAAEVSAVNYSFFMGASNDNLEEVLKTDPKRVCGVKVFMGSSTGNMLVDNRETLEGLFKECPMLIAAHCEDEGTIRANLAEFKQRYGEDIPISAHPLIRNAEACYRSSSMAVEMAEKFGTRFHVLHISTEKELALFRNDIPLSEKKVTNEVCVHHLSFNDTQYAEKGTHIKWNPAVKTEQDRQALWAALLDDRLDMLATDHAPHTLEEKANGYLNAPSGGPLVQHALVAMLDAHHAGQIAMEKVVEKLCHAPAIGFRLAERGFLREGYKADLVLVNPDDPWTVSKENILYKCAWSPFEGREFQSKVEHTFVNGEMVYDRGTFNENVRGERATFNR